MKVCSFNHEHADGDGSFEVCQRMARGEIKVVEEKKGESAVARARRERKEFSRQLVEFERIQERFE